MKLEKSDIFSITNTIIATLGFIFVIVQMNKATEEFKHSKINEKAQLLSMLHQRAFESEEMMDVFRKIEYNTMKFITTDFNDPEFHKSPNQQNLIELLSFFELIGTLRSLGLLSITEISETFGYYIIRTYHNREVEKYRTFLTNRAKDLGIKSGGGIVFPNFELLANELLELQTNASFKTH
ncbi:MAG: hypothetical protein D3926_20060 [Desulfobacteraceae bacterium]|nr:MAG: hypothetical protein D3926_20060 [Desulfobacteraceae bacterium]